MMPDFVLPLSMQQLAEAISGKSLHRQIQRVQVFFHQRYGYFIGDDKRTILTPMELAAAGKGDCKAHAISKYLVLLRAGVPMSDMRLVLTRNEQRIGHMILLVGDRVLDLKAFVYATTDVPYIPINGFNHQSHGCCEGAAEALLGFGRREDVIWDFNYITFDNKVWRFLHTYHFWHWRKFNKKLEAEMQSDFAKTLQVSPLERAVAEVGVIPDTRAVSPETEREVQVLFAQSGGKLTPAIFGKLSARAQTEMQNFIRSNQAGLMAIADKLGVKL